MPLVPVELPPGIYKNGTPYKARGRWADGNRVRWHDGSLRAIGGWQRRTIKSTDVDMEPVVSNPVTETIRDMWVWTDNAGNEYSLLGSNSALYWMNANNDTVDVTPAGFTGGNNVITRLFGYGIGPYGRGPYGVARSSTGAKIETVFRWSFDSWGEDVLCAGIKSGPLYVYPNADPIAVVVPEAPTDFADFCVTSQRIVMVIDPAGYDVRTVVWSDRENYSEWTPTKTNYAGFFNLSGVGSLVSISKIQNQVLVLSETDAHVGRYLGAPLVYGFERVGEDCGPLNSKVVQNTDRFAMWLSDRAFWIYDGSLKPVPCEVMDFLKSDISRAHVSKMWCHSVDNFHELWWHYQSVGATEVDSYVSYDYLDGSWAVGKLPRTAGMDAKPLSTAVYVDPDGLVWNHEIEAVLTPDSWAVTGPIEIQAGERNVAVKYIYPDTEVEGSVYITLYGRQMPTAPEITFGPYEYINPTSTRAMGREIRMRVDGLINTWEVGTMRFDVAYNQSVGQR